MRRLTAVIDDHSFVTVDADVTLCLTNCLTSSSYLNVGSGSQTIFTDHLQIINSGTAFQTGAAANYYLATSSPYRNAGTASITPALWSELQTMTTYAPQDGGWPDTNAPDLGYHYPVNEDSDYDGLPDWWEWHWFGNYTHVGSESDPSGNTLLPDYQNYANGTVTNDPNVIQFTIESANDYVNHTNVSVQLDITAGVPSYYAVFVNSTTTTNWLPFTGTNLMVTLGSSDGTYNVVVGLKGLPAEATESWQAYGFTVDRIAPQLALTNPILAGATATAIKPYLQLQGLADEQLASLSYDISNAVAVLTNQDMSVNDQYFDTNKFDFTTNCFHACDVPLTTNDNFITVRVTDRAGNTTTTNFTVVLDYTSATNAPTVKLIWPEDNMAIYGSSFTLRGTMSDETGTVWARVVDGAGNTNVVEGLVERNGMFWVENLPLTTNGDNVVTVTATDAAGNVTTTNIMVFESEVVLTIDSTPTGDDLYKPTGSVSGTVSEESWEVYVNGMRVNVDTNENSQSTYNWTSDNVPVYGKGTATFDAVALPSGAAPPPANNSATIEFSARLELFTYHIHTHLNTDDTSLWPYGDEWTKDSTDKLVRGANDWQKVRKGKADDRSWDDDDTQHDPSLNQDTTWETVGKAHYEWDGPTELTENWSYLNGALTGHTTANHVDEEVKNAPESAGWGPEYYADGGHCDWFQLYQGGGSTEWEVDAKTELKLYTGGKAKVIRRNLFCIQCSGTEYKGLPWIPYGKDIPKDQLRAMGKQVGADGKVWKVLDDNDEQLVGLVAPGKKHYYAEASPAKYYLVSRCRCSRQNLARTDVGVGEVVDIYFSSTGSDKILTPPPVVLPLPATAPINWTTTAGNLSPVSSYCGTVLTNPHSEDTATVTATVQGEKLTIGFEVIEPSGIKATQRGPESFPVGQVGAGMYLDIVLQPTTVSFYQLEIIEPAEATTGITGYFTNHTPPTHAGNGADEWHPVGCDNKVYSPPYNYFDHANSYGWPIGVSGSFTWPINPLWRVVGDSATHSLSGWTDQIMTLSTDGTMRVDKFGLYVIRHP